jgi:DHA1 family inner membrane transport protein
MTFFTNSAVNRVNLHGGVQTLAQGAGGVFVLAYLLRAGVPLPLVFLTMSGMTLGRFALRPGVLPLARRLGLKRTVMLGTVLEGAVFPILPHVHGAGVLWGVVILVSSLGSVLYWTCYHAYFASLGDAEHRGAQIGAREAVMACVNIVAPALGGWGLATVGPQPTFWLVALTQACAAVPLAGLPDVPVAAEAPGGFKAARLGALLMGTDGWFGAGYYYIWQVVLFVALGERFAAFGAAMAIAGLLGAGGSLVVGRLIDLGHGVRSTFAIYAFAAGTLVFKAMAYGSPALAVVANAAGAMAASLLMPVLMTRVYNLSQASPCPLRFHIATEGGWDLGCGLGCLSAAVFTWAGLPFSACLLIGLAGAAILSLLLTGSYGRLARA